MSESHNLKHYPQFPATQVAVKIDGDHPAHSATHHWHYRNQRIQQKPQADIDAIEAIRASHVHPRSIVVEHEILLNEINELRRALNLPEKTLLEMQRAPSKERDNR
jgi:hypothetical protein